MDFKKWSFLLLLILSVTSGLVYGAEADIVDGEEDVVVEDGDVRTGDSVVTDEDLEAVKSLKPHSDADTYFLITKPTGLGNQLPAGKDVSFLVGFTNNGKTNFIVESMEASFRYAMDFSFHLQNFSAIAYNRLVKPNEQATFAYSFFVSEAYSTRPYGFTVNLNYKDAEGNEYLSPVFNETVSIIELDEGLDGETFFLYVILTGLLSLGLFSIYHYLFASKRRSFVTSVTSKKTVETGTANHNDVDYDWLPKGTLEAMNKSPKAAKPSSPRQRKIRSE